MEKNRQYGLENLNVIIIGAHPDDPEFMLGGSALLWRAGGASVKMVTMTNGDAGHQQLAPVVLAARREKEVAKAAAILDVDYEIMDNHDGKLTPSIENRLELIRLLREYKPDLVITHDSHDYHPDHRVTCQLVADCSYLLNVPAILPEVPIIKKNPYFFFAINAKSSALPEVCIPIDKVWQQKILALHQHESQMYEWLPWINQFDPTYRDNRVPELEEERLQYLSELRSKWACSLATKYRGYLHERYGDAADSIKRIEALYQAPFGLTMSAEAIGQFFPLPSLMNSD